MTRRPLYPTGLWVVWALGVPLAVLAVAFALAALTDIGRSEIGEYDALDLWWLTLLVPLCGALCVYSAARRRRGLETFTSAPLAPLLTEGFRPARPAIRAGLATLAIALLAMAIIGPRWGVYLEERRAYGVDIVVAVDVSRSMLARDVTPNRLARAKQLIQQQLTERGAAQQSNRYGLLAFAGSASMKAPLSLDHAFFRKTVDELNIGSAPHGGTVLAEAIYAAADFFAASPKEATKIILLVTDGEDHEGDPVAAAREMNEEHGIQIYTIGVGDDRLPAGAQVPEGADSDKPLLHEGQIVFSKINVDSLRQIAEAGGGRYTPIESFPRLVEAIGEMNKQYLTTEERMRYKPRYQWFLAAALGLLLVESLVRERSRGAMQVPMRTWQQEAA